MTVRVMTYNIKGHGTLLRGGHIEGIAEVIAEAFGGIQAVLDRDDRIHGTHDNRHRPRSHVAAVVI